MNLSGQGQVIFEQLIMQFENRAKKNPYDHRGPPANSPPFISGLSFLRQIARNSHFSLIIGRSPLFIPQHYSQKRNKIITLSFFKKRPE